MSTDDATAHEVPFSTLVIGRRPWLSVVAAMAALVSSGLVTLGAIVAVELTGPTLIRGADGASFAEWAPPIAVWQWLIAGAIEVALIGMAAAAWWGAWSLWAGRSLPGLALPSPRPFALGAGVAMIAASVLALVTHIRNWREWRTLVSQHPEWGESPQAWQIPVGGVVVALIVSASVAAMILLLRRTSAN
jgi:hypothetical protein